MHSINGPGAGRNEQIIANDSTGTHVLDTAQTVSPSQYTDPPVLTNLARDGNTLTWQHDGQTMTATLG